MLNILLSHPRHYLNYFLLILFAGLLGLYIAISSYDWQGMLVVFGVLGIVAVFLLPRLARIEYGSFILKVMIFGLLLRFVFAMIDSWFAFTLYGGTADASHYNRLGTVVAQNIRGLEFDKVFAYFNWGTDFIIFFTGVIYSITGPTLYGGYLVYAFFAFMGSYFFYRTFRIASPAGNKTLFTILIFFFPSVLFWANGIGKDSLIFFFIGLFAFGGAKLTQNQWRGLLPMAIGFLGTMYIRPHIAAILALAFFLSFLVHGFWKRSIRPAILMIGILAVAALFWILLPRVMDFIGAEQLSPQGLLARFQQQGIFTSEGGSSFQTMDLNNPLTYLITLVTILFRPFPWEAHNVFTIIQGMEGIIVMGLVIWRIKSLGKALASSASNNYLLFILIYVIAFTIYCSTIGNFGILARVRLMFLPFLFMLLAYSPPGKKTVAGSEMYPVLG